MTKAWVSGAEMTSVSVGVPFRFMVPAAETTGLLPEDTADPAGYPMAWDDDIDTPSAIDKAAIRPI